MPTPRTTTAAAVVGCRAYTGEAVCWVLASLPGYQSFSPWDLGTVDSGGTVGLGAAVGAGVAVLRFGGGFTGGLGGAVTEPAEPSAEADPVGAAGGAD